MTHQYPDPEDASIFARYPSTGFSFLDPPSDLEAGVAQNARRNAIESRTNRYLTQDSLDLSSGNEMEFEADGTAEDTGRDSDGDYRM